MTGTNPEMQEVTLSFLHPRGPSRSFLYSHKADILTVHISDILTFVEPITYPDILTDNENNTSTSGSRVVKEFIYLTVCACMERGSIYTAFFVFLCFPATLGLSGYYTYVKSEMF